MNIENVGNHHLEIYVPTAWHFFSGFQQHPNPPNGNFPASTIHLVDPSGRTSAQHGMCLLEIPVVSGTQPGSQKNWIITNLPKHRSFPSKSTRRNSTKLHLSWFSWQILIEKPSQHPTSYIHPAEIRVKKMADQRVREIPMIRMSRDHFCRLFLAKGSPANHPLEGHFLAKQSLDYQTSPTWISDNFYH